MENEELITRLEWLEAERRKDKQLISELTIKISELIGEIGTQKSKMKALEIDQKKSLQNAVRKEEFDEIVSKQKIEIVHQIQDLEKKVTTSERRNEKQRKDDLDTVNKRLLELQNDIKPINEIKKSYQARVDEEYRLAQRLDGIQKNLSDLQMTNAEFEKTQKMLEENYRLEAKKFADIQIEVGTLRKKIDESRASDETHKEFVRKLENRVNEILSQEQLRKQEQIAFIESQSRSHVDRDNLWKEWQSKIDQVDKLGVGIQAQMLDLDNTHRAVKKAQADFEEINQRLDRRINEITEMNRLAEERFRQEWVSFKADDQKRWTNYSLTQEEESREGSREISRVTERLTKLEDASQTLIDAVNIINEETEKRIKALMSLSNELMNSFEKTLGRRI
mgnify:CR=1 FL=1